MVAVEGATTIPGRSVHDVTANAVGESGVGDDFDALVPSPMSGASLWLAAGVSGARQ